MAGLAEAVFRILPGLSLGGTKRPFRGRLLMVRIPSELMGAKDLIDPYHDMVAVHALAAADLEGLKTAHLPLA